MECKRSPIGTNERGTQVRAYDKAFFEVMMNPTERLLRILDHLPVDRVAVTGFLVSVTVELMKATGIELPEAHQDPVQMVRLAAAAHEILGLESVKVPFDMTVEAGALGARIDYGTETILPQVKVHPFQDPREFLSKEDFVEGGRIPVVLEAIRIARNEYGDRVPVISSIVGPVTLSGMLFGTDTLLLWMLSEPEIYASVLSKATRLCIAYAEEQFKAGSHTVQLADPVSSGDLISSEQYRKFVLPYHRLFFQAFRSPIVIHICGNITGHLPFLAEMNPRGVSFDQKTDIQEVMKWLKGKSAIIGYVPTSLLLEGSAEEVYQSSMECLRSGVDILNSGCVWPIQTSNDNIRAMIRAARDWTNR